MPPYKTMQMTHFLLNVFKSHTKETLVSYMMKMFKMYYWVPNKSLKENYLTYQSGIITL